MTRPGRPCPEVGCPELQPCSKHRRPGRWETSTRRLELPKDWAKRRRRRLAMDGGKCQRCGAPASDVHHRGAPDDHELDQLESLCHPCHELETNAARAEAMRRRVR